MVNVTCIYEFLIRILFGMRTMFEKFIGFDLNRFMKLNVHKDGGALFIK